MKKVLLICLSVLLVNASLACGDIRGYGSMYFAFDDPGVKLQALCGLLCVTPIEYRYRNGSNDTILSLIVNDAKKHPFKSIQKYAEMVEQRFEYLDKKELFKKEISNNPLVEKLRKIGRDKAYRSNSRNKIAPDLTIKYLMDSIFVDNSTDIDRIRKHNPRYKQNTPARITVKDPNFGTFHIYEESFDARRRSATLDVKYAGSEGRSTNKFNISVSTYVSSESSLILTYLSEIYEQKQIELAEENKRCEIRKEFDDIKLSSPASKNIENDVQLRQIVRNGDKVKKEYKYIFETYNILYSDQRRNIDSLWSVKLNPYLRRDGWEDHFAEIKPILNVAVELEKELDVILTKYLEIVNSNEIKKINKSLKGIIDVEEIEGRIFQLSLDLDE